MLSLALAAAAFHRVDTPARAAPALAEVRAFAERNAAPVLLAIDGTGSGSAGSPGG